MVLVGISVDVLVLTGISLVGFAVVSSVLLRVIVVPEVLPVVTDVGKAVVLGLIVDVVFAVVPREYSDVVDLVVISVRSFMFSLVVVGTTVLTVGISVVPTGLVGIFIVYCFVD